MKVVLLAQLPPPAGGIASWTVRMQNTVLKNGWTLEVVDEKVIGRSIHGDNNKKKFWVEGKRCLNIWNNLKKALRDPETKVVRACTAGTATGMLRDTVSAWISHRKHKKYIIHFRCTIPNFIHGGITEKIFKMLCNVSDLVMTLNSQSSAFVEKRSKTPVKLIPNFVSDSELNAGGSHQYPEIAQTVLYTGGVTELKGCTDIIQAAMQIPELTFRLVGNIRSEINEMNIPENVTLTGVQNKEFVQDELKKADIYIFFTHYPREGFSNSLAEAMGAGLPCIVTDWAANADMIEDQGGVVLPVHDVDGLVAAIRKLKDDRVLRQRMGNWNMEKVRSSYSEQIVTGQYVDVYEQLIRG